MGGPSVRGVRRSRLRGGTTTRGGRYGRKVQQRAARPSPSHPIRQLLSSVAAANTLTHHPPTWPCRPPRSAAATIARCSMSAATSISPCCQLPAQRMRDSQRSQEARGMCKERPAAAAIVMVVACGCEGACGRVGGVREGAGPHETQPTAMQATPCTCAGPKTSRTRNRLSGSQEANARLQPHLQAQAAPPPPPAAAALPPAAAAPRRRRAAAAAAPPPVSAQRAQQGCRQPRTAPTECARQPRQPRRALRGGSRRGKRGRLGSGGTLAAALSSRA